MNYINIANKSVNISVSIFTVWVILTHNNVTCDCNEAAGNEKKNTTHSTHCTSLCDTGIGMKDFLKKYLIFLRLHGRDVWVKSSR
jgi:hypothetical protein